MGAVRFSIDPGMVRHLVTELGIEVFVETGTYEGASVLAVLPFFTEIHTIELSEELCARAKEAFANQPEVHVHQGHSPDVLKELAPKLKRRRTLFWLDAHWSDQPRAAGQGERPPLLEELAAIGSLGPDSVVMIDDARLIVAPPPAPADPDQWPELERVLTGLSNLSHKHEPMVIDDVILFFPSKAKDAVREYAQRGGADWLTEQARARKTNQRLERIEQTISQMRVAESRALERRLAELESRLESVPTWLVRLARLRPEPKLGNLKHHPPMELDIPKRYLNSKPPENPPSISIVTPSYNQSSFLERTIRSVVEQEYPCLEYVVQDGGSSDRTREVLERYSPKLEHWEMGTDDGQAQAINLGFAHTSGEIMAYLNSDDLLLPGSLRYVGRYFEAHPDVDVIYGHRVLIDESDREIGRWVLPRHRDPILAWADYVPQETLFWRRRAWGAAGGRVDEEFRFAIDWDLLLRLRDAGARIVRVPRFIGAFRVHGAQKTTAELDTAGAEETTRILRREHHRDVPAKEVSRELRGYLRRHVALHKLYRAGLIRY